MSRAPYLGGKSALGESNERVQWFSAWRGGAQKTSTCVDEYFELMEPFPLLPLLPTRLFEWKRKSSWLGWFTTPLPPLFTPTFTSVAKWVGGRGILASSCIHLFVSLSVPRFVGSVPFEPLQRCEPFLPWALTSSDVIFASVQVCFFLVLVLSLLLLSDWCERKYFKLFEDLVLRYPSRLHLLFSQKKFVFLASCSWLNFD